MKKILKNKRVLFLIIVIGFYLGISLINPSLGQLSFGNFLKIFSKILPLFIVVFLIMFFINYFISDKVIRKRLGGESGRMGIIFAIIFGIIISGPSYILFPLLRDFRNKGATNFILAVFLYNRNIKIPFIPVMVYYFGLVYTIIISIYIILFSLLNGVLVDYFTREKHVGRI